MTESARLASMESQQGAENTNLGDALASGVYQGVEAGAGIATSGMMGAPPPKPAAPGAAGGTGGHSVGRASGLYKRGKSGSMF